MYRRWSLNYVGSGFLFSCAGFKSLKDSKAAFVSNPSLLVAQCSERHRVQVVSGQNKCSVWLMRVCVASPLLCVRGRRCFEVLGKLFSDGPLSLRANQRGAKITGFRFSVELSSFFCSKRLVLTWLSLRISILGCCVCPCLG